VVNAAIIASPPRANRDSRRTPGRDGTALIEWDLLKPCRAASGRMPALQDTLSLDENDFQNHTSIKNHENHCH
jgi:hypothetical protein